MRKYSKLMAVLLVFAMILPGIAQAAPVADEEVVTRLAGKGRVETSVAASEIAFEDGGAKNVVIAGYYGEVDALTGTLLANAKNAPLILTNEDKLPNVVKEELERLGAENVYILGGEKAVSADVEADLKEDYTVERVAGDDREKTAVAVAEEVDGQTDHVFLAKGYDILADALAVGPVSAMKDMPVFLTNTNRTTDATLDAMKDLGVKEVTIIGGEQAVTQSVVEQLEDYKVNRIEGDDREKTALAIADEFFTNPKHSVVASGYVYADALVGGYLGAKMEAPILLTNVNRIATVSTDYIKANSEQVYVLGGKAAVSEDVLAEVETAVEGEEELVVESVSAISDTVDKDGTLEFAINGEEEAADLEALEEEGYEVKFLASKDVLKSDKEDSTEVVNTNTTGKVKAEDAKDNKFKYQVVVSKDDEEVVKSERQEVEVQDYENTAVEIRKVEVKLDKQEITDGQLALKDENVTLTVKGLVKGSDKEVTFDEATFKSNRPAVLKVDENGKVTPKAKGTATVTVKVGEVEKEVELKVGDARKVDATKSSIDTDTLELATDETATVTVELKDQYGLEVLNAKENIEAANADEKVAVITKDVTVKKAEDEKGKAIDGKYKLTLTAAAKKAEGDVTVTANNVTLGKIKVNVLEAGDAVSYKLTAENTKYDLIENKETKNECVQTELKAYDNQGLETKLPELDVEYVSSDENVVNVDADGVVKFQENVKAGDKATVTAKKVTGAFKDTIAELEFTVVDTTPELKSVSIKDHDTITKDTVIDLSDLITFNMADEGAEFEYTRSEDNTINVSSKDVKIATIEFTNDATISFLIDDTAGKVKVSLVDKTAKKQTGNLNIAVVNKDNKFEADTNIAIEIPALTDEEALEASVAEVVKLDKIGNHTIKGQGVSYNEGTFTASYNAWDTKTDEKTITPNVISDLARYMGELYRIDSGATVDTIVFNDVEYTWDTSLNLRGSQWKNGEQSLMAALQGHLLEQIENNNTTFKNEGKFSLELKNGNATKKVNFELTIEE